MVNIDTVYQRVLAIANKEQRGYITPLEFNLLANQAQLDVFEQYFYDRNQTARGPGNSTPFSVEDTSNAAVESGEVVLIPTWALTTETEKQHPSTSAMMARLGIHLSLLQMEFRK